MGDVHECEVCGMYCACDCDDLRGPQPSNCDHLMRDCPEDSVTVWEPSDDDEDTDHA